MFKNIDSLKLEINKFLENEIEVNIIAKYISYVITGKIDCLYNQELLLMLAINCKIDDNHGLLNLLNKMISENNIPVPEEEQLITPIPSFNLTFKNQKELHPCIDFLYSKLTPFHDYKSDIIMDLYLEDTFGINQKVYELLNILPYKNYWYGFIYKSVFEFNEVFIDSLKYCKGLFVFSNEIKKQLENKLNVQLKITVLCFPVNEPIRKFENNFYKNGNIICTKSDIFSFYKTKFKIVEKKWLRKSKTRILDKYIIGNEQSLEILYQKNDFSHSLSFFINQIIKSVKKIELKNVDLDILLSQNIVFCDTNSDFFIQTLNECIVRNTPIIINRQSVAVELLGSDYPLYFDDSDCCELIINLKQIKKAYKYLKKMNKNKYSINTFLGKINRTLEN